MNKNSTRFTHSNINVDYLSRCILVLENSYSRLNQQNFTDIERDIYRSACVKEFELILEQCGKFLKKRLRDFFHSNQFADQLTFKDIFRYATKHGLISIESSERWLNYRDHRNDTAHNYGEDFAEQILKVIPSFIQDAKTVVDVLKKNYEESK